MNNFLHEFDNEYKLKIDLTNDKFGELTYGNCIDIEKDNSRKVNVFYNYFKPDNKKRAEEIFYCFEKMLKNIEIDKLYVFCSDDLSIMDNKLIKIKIDCQPRFKDFFNIIDFYSNDVDINIILNSDCYFDEKNIELIKSSINYDDAYLLSRWDILSLKPFKIEHFDIVNKNKEGLSQDAWIFIGRPKEGFDGDYKMGIAGCDNSIAYEFENVGYDVINPSLTIKVYHYHLTKIRTYGDYTDREQHRIEKKYKFIPSTFMSINKIGEGKNIIFYNHYHNGDIHYSRQFIKDIMKKYNAKSFSYYFDLNYVGSKNILKDIQINYKNVIPKEIQENETLLVSEDDVYINTWVGQKYKRLVNDIGINLEANYEIYAEIYKKLNIKLENKEYYIPSIDYTHFDLNLCDRFLKKYKDNFKILISNGCVLSAQSSNFNMNDFISDLAKQFEDIIFILTDSKNKLDNENIFYTSDIIKKEFDLNEISYLSLYCDMIIGRSSGPYAFCMVKENLFNDKKTILCLSDKKEYEWYISDMCNHIISNAYEKNDLIKLIKTEIDSSINRKPRIAFTIILNGLHHLKHNNYAEKLCNMFDYWVIIEGAAENKGSTSWCKKMPDNYHKNGKSIDGTVEYIKNLKKKHENVIFVESNGIWNSKDDMVNTAIDEVKKLTDKCFLWEIDIDEQWEYDQIVISEKELKRKNSKTGKFNVIQFVGENLITEGKDWSGIPFTRLWNWDGEYFEKHEPPILKTTDKSSVILSEKMKHYSFYFEQDVKFKNDWYNYHEESYNNWLKLKKEKIFPQHITYLFPNFKDSPYLTNNKDLDCRIVRNDGNLNAQKVNIYFNYFKSESEDRNKEMEFCLNKLIFNNKIDKIYLLCSDRYKKDVTDKVIKIDLLGTQPTFNQIFEIINSNTKNRDLNILLNSDCYVDVDNIELIKNNIKENFVYCLSRWDIVKTNPFQTKHFGLENSQDAWVFVGKINNVNADFKMGIPGCDNALAYEIDKAGYNIINPSKDIKIYHYHLSGIRNYKKENAVSSSYKYVPICSLKEIEIKKIKKQFSENLFNDFVDNVYCINLLKREDKSNHMTKQFNKFRIGFEFFRAIDGQNLNINTTKLKKGKIGQLKSHANVIKDAIENGYEKIAIFEDDVILCDDFLERFDYYSKNIPDNWDIMFLGSDLKMCYPPKLVKQYIYRLTNGRGSFAMILNNKNGLFQKLIKLFGNENRTVDEHMIFDIIPKNICYTFLPYFTKILDISSDIQESDNKLRYRVVNDYFKDVVDLPKPVLLDTVKPQTIVRKTLKEIFNEYKNSIEDFQIFVDNKLLFDSSKGNKNNLIFFEERFTLNGRSFNYNGMNIKKK